MQKQCTNIYMKQYLKKFFKSDILKYMYTILTHTQY